MRHDFDFVPGLVHGVSIHAPTRGATGTFDRGLDAPLGFNPRTHAGCDSVLADQHVDARLVSIHAPTRGATSTIPRYRIVCTVSIHAPTRGATRYAWGLLFDCIMFQSTHPRGVRLYTKLQNGNQLSTPHILRLYILTHFP